MTETKTTEAVPDRALRVAEVAERLQLSRSKVYELMASGRLPSIPGIAAKRVSPRVLEQFMAGELPWQKKLAS